jgi:hypothetical protein
MNILKMKHVRFYIIFSMVISYSCNETDKLTNVSLRPTDEIIKINLGRKEANYTFLSQHFVEMDTNYLAVLNDQNHSINIYNLDKEVLTKIIKIEKEGINAFPHQFGFVIKNLDTVILITNFPPKICIQNRGGQMIKTISFQDIDEKFNPIVLPDGRQQGILIDNKLYLMHEMAIQNFKIEFTKENQKQSKVAVAIDLGNGKVETLPLNYPEQIVGKDIFAMTKSWTLGYNNSFIYSFSILNSLFVTEKFDKFDVVPINSDYKFDLPENMSKIGDLESGLKYLMGKDAIYNLHYDRYREVYYVVVRKREQEIEKKPPFRANSYPNGMIIILNKNFENIGEVHLPQDIYFLKNIFIAKKGLYISMDNVDNPDYNEDMMKFRLFELKNSQ